MKKLILSILFCTLFVSVYSYNNPIREMATDTHIVRGGDAPTHTFFAFSGQQFRFSVTLNANGLYPTNGIIIDNYGGYIASVTLYLNHESNTGKQYLGVIKGDFASGTIQYDVSIPAQIGDPITITVHKDIVLRIP